MAQNLLAFFTESAFDACWHLFFEIDLKERIKIRAQQKAFLARYGRIPWHAWEGRTVLELNATMRAIGEVIEREGASTPEDL